MATPTQEKVWEEMDQLIKTTGNRDGFDIYELKSLQGKKVRYHMSNLSFRVFICIFIQIFGPLFVLIYVVVAAGQDADGQDDDDLDAFDWRNMCKGLELEGWTNSNGWEIMVKIFNKLLGVVFVFYMGYFANKEVEEIYKDRPFNFIFVNRSWAKFGLLVNCICSFLCTFASIFVIYLAKHPLDIVLNSIALFYIMQVDDDIVDKGEAQYISGKLKELLKFDKKRVVPEAEAGPFSAEDEAKMKECLEVFYVRDIEISGDTPLIKQVADCAIHGKLFLQVVIGVLMYGGAAYNAVCK